MSFKRRKRIDDTQRTNHYETINANKSPSSNSLTADTSGLEKYCIYASDLGNDEETLLEKQIKKYINKNEISEIDVYSSEHDFVLLSFSLKIPVHFRTDVHTNVHTRVLAVVSDTNIAYQHNVAAHYSHAIFVSESQLFFNRGPFHSKFSLQQSVLTENK